MSFPAQMSPRPAAIFLLPPPAYFGLSFVAGMLLNSLLPLPFPDFPGRSLLGLTALSAATGGLLLLVTSFLWRRTTLNPFGSPSQLFVGGPYRFSRNPMYLGLFAAYLGGCLLSQSWWPVLLVVVPAVVLERVVIPFEEKRLRSRFGGEFDAYCARVRRWVGRR